jgi:hypothetical protein
MSKPAADPFSGISSVDVLIPTEWVGGRHTAHEVRRIRAFGDEPFGSPINADFVEQRAEPNACPFRAGDRSVQSLHVAWHRPVARC